MNELDFIYQRKSIRDYKEGTVPKEDILKMLDAATYAPSPKHQQNWHFVVVQDKSLIDKMAEAVTISHKKIASMARSEKEEKSFLKFLPYYLNFQRASCTVIVYGKDYEMIEEDILRASGISEEYISLIKTPHPDAQGIGAAVENFLLAASALGYGACYMTGPAHAKDELEKIVGFHKPGYSLMAMISLGIPSDKTVNQPPRKPLDEVVTFI